MMEINPVEKPNIEVTPIQQFYDDAQIFITGGTGFLGRVLLEKLLRSCPNISTIYIMVRSKKGKNLTTRVDELFDDFIFEKLREVCPKFRHKVVAIEGDCCLPGLGLSELDRQRLSAVNIIFHAAATVKFDEKLKLAVAINVEAPLFLLEMAKEMKQLKAFMHVSTAYTNCIQPIIEEKVYPVPMEHEKLIMITKNLPEKLVDSITPQLLGRWPNTYTFTKAIAENIISKGSEGIPAAIFRPSIIISTYKEPIPAWINNMYGPTGICAAAASGILRTLYCDQTVNGNMVPVDMCVSALIATAWEVGANFEKHKDKANREVPVYHYESSNDQPITWGEFMDLNAHHGPNYPTIKAMWCYTLTLQKNRYIYLLLMFWLHLVPAFIIDGGLMCIGKEPMMMKIYKKIHKFSDALQYFTIRTFKYHSNRTRNLIDNMSKKDREIFFCDLKKLDWNEFFEVYIKGMRIYLMQDDISTIDDARVRWRRFVFLHKVLKIILIIIGLQMIWAISSYFYSVIFC